MAELITRTEAQILADAREVLKVVSNRAGQEELYGGNASALGRLAGVADAAEDGIFDVLNCAQAYLENEIAKEFVHQVGQA